MFHCYRHLQKAQYCRPSRHTPFRRRSGRTAMRRAMRATTRRARSKCRPAARHRQRVPLIASQHHTPCPYSSGRMEIPFQPSSPFALLWYRRAPSPQPLSRVTKSSTSGILQPRVSLDPTTCGTTGSSARPPCDDPPAPAPLRVRKTNGESRATRTSAGRRLAAVG